MSLYGGVGASSVRPGPVAHPLAAAAAAPGPPPSRKRKDRDDDYVQDPEARANSTHAASPSFLSLPRPPPPHVRRPLPVPADRRLGKPLPPQQQQQHPQPHARLAPPTAPAKPGGNRLLMAGYLAHEFLSRGTLLGRPYGTAAAALADTAGKEELQLKQKQQYEEVARILWGGGVHVPGVVNPTQLGGWLQKQQEK